MGFEAYQIANLNVHPEMVREIQALEQKFKQEFGESITLIAYASKETTSTPKGN